MTGCSEHSSFASEVAIAGGATLQVIANFAPAIRVKAVLIFPVDQVLPSE